MSHPARAARRAMLETRPLRREGTVRKLRGRAPGQRTTTAAEDAAEICQRLRRRAPEMQEAMAVRLFGAPWESADVDGEILSGRLEAVRACIEAALASIEYGRGERVAGVPLALLEQARQVADAGGALAPVLGACVTGFRLLAGFVLEETRQAEIGEAERLTFLDHATGALTALLADFVTAVTDTHTQESGTRPQSRERRLAKVVQELLLCRPVNPSELSYDLDDEHVGLIVSGPDASAAVARLARALDSRLLSIERSEGVVWAWLAGAGSITERDLGLITCDESLRFAVGERAPGGAGFRATHRQARTAWLVAQHQQQRMTRYADVLLLAPALRSRELGDELISIYLSPLDEARERTPTLKETLRAYLEAEQNTSSAAAKLRIDRRTATTRIRVIEERLGFPLHTRRAELEVALRLERLRARPAA